MAHFLPLLAQRLIGQPLLITPDGATAVATAIRGRLIPGANDVDLRPAANGLLTQRRTASGDMSLAPRAQGGMAAVIPVQGELVNRGAYVEAMSSLTSYDGIEAQLIEADADADVRLIVLDIDSPGGEAGGMVGLAAKIRGLSTRTVAVVNDLAASAAYGIAAACDEILISPTGMVGSIGVVLLHVDQSRAIENAGITTTLIHAGAHKVDGNSLAPLSEPVRADLQAMVNATYDLFIASVAEGRGSRLSADAARATEARVLMGQEAINAGLADRFGTLSTALAGITTARVARKGKAKMDPEEEKKRAAQIETARAEALAEGTAQGASAERARIKSILTSDAAAERPKFAMHVALEDDRDADKAVAMLAAAPAEGKAEAAIPPLSQRGAGADLGGDVQAQDGGRAQRAAISKAAAQRASRM